MARLKSFQFGLIPRWVVDLNLSYGAFYLYGLLSAKYCNRENAAWPSRGAIAKDMKCSRATVDRAVTELKARGALRVTSRSSREKGWQPNEYVLVQIDPLAASVGLGSRTDDDTLAPLLLNKPDPIEPDPRTAEKGSQTQDVPEPVAGSVFTGGIVPPKRPKGRHRTHIVCSAVYCVTADRLDKDQQRLRAAGLDPHDLDLEAWYREALKAMVEETPAEPGLWIYQRLTEDIKSAQAEVA